MTRTLALVLLAAAIAPPAALGHSHKQKALEIVHPWTSAMVEEGIVNIPVYMTIKNGGRTMERLVGASTPLADKVEFIAPQSHGPIKLPTPVASLAIPAHGSLELTSSGPHLLLSGVKRRLGAYDSFALTLVFETAGEVPVEVAVEEAETTAPHKH